MTLAHITFGVRAVVQLVEDPGLIPGKVTGNFQASAFSSPGVH